MPDSREQGAAAVEFALVLPLLVGLLFGITDFGWVFFQQISLSNAARESARYYVVHENDVPPTTPGAAADIGMGAAPMVDWTKTGAGITLRQGCDSALPNFDVTIGKTVTTAATIPMPSLTGVFSAILGPTLTSKGQMACID